MTRFRHVPALAAVLAVAVGCGRSAGPNAAAPAVAVSAAPAPAAADLCVHEVPAELCTRCEPALAEVFRSTGDWCEEHGLPESHCRACHPSLTFPAGSGEAPTRIRLASTSAEIDAGIESAPAEERRIAPSVEVFGRVAFDAARHARLSPRADSVVVRFLVDLGDRVSKGQSVVELRSASVGGDQARLASARARRETAKSAFERESALLAKGITARREVDEARRALAEADAELSSAETALGISGAGTAGGRHALVAPFAGIVVARAGAPGETAGTDDVLVEIADTATMWVELSVPEREANALRSGQSVTVWEDGSPETTFPGRIARISAAIDERTRTVSARAEIRNAGAKALRAGAFVRARIETGPERAAILVPEGAVQKTDGRSVVFVRRAPATFEAVPVKVHGTRDGRTEVTGVSSSDSVVDGGAFLLRTELSKDSIGAGCCEVGTN